MHRLGAYVVSLTAVSLISAVLQSLLRDGPERKILRLVCGVLTIVVALSPICEISYAEWEYSFSSHMEEGRKNAEYGKTSASSELSEYIMENLEAYIYEKATRMGLDPSVKLQLDENGYPGSIQITGAFSETDRKRLQQMITDDLGIPKENQQWNG